MSMLETAEIVAERYQITRERQDDYALQSQQRTAARAGRRPLRRGDRAAAERDEGRRQGDRRDHDKEVTLKHDEGNRADTTLAGLAGAEAGVRGRRCG